MENNNLKLKELGDKIKLSKTEKVFHRQEILNFMDSKVPVQSPYLKEKVFSSFSFNFFIKKHFILTSLVIISFLSTGIVAYADHAVPNDYLFQMRVKVVEPTKILLAPTIEKKNNLRVKFVNEALKDYSQVSQKEEIKQSDKVALINSISSNIKDLNIEISNLDNEINSSNSLKTANNLKSVLSAHSIVLDKLDESNPQNDTEALSAKIEEGLSKTEDTINTITKSIQTSDDSEKMDQTIIDQKEEINISLKKIEDDTKVTSTEDSEDALSTSSSDEIDIKLLEIDTLSKEGDKKFEEGNKKEAVDIYNQVDQKVGELESLIESSQDLNIKILNKKIEIKGVDEQIMKRGKDFKYFKTQ